MEKTIVRTKYACPKCGGHEFEIGDAFMADSQIAKFLNFETKRLCTVTCKKCTYTEMYSTSKKNIQNVLDGFVVK